VNKFFEPFKEALYTLASGWHYTESLRRLRALENSNPAPEARWRIPFEYRGRGFFKRIQPMQSEFEIRALYLYVLQRKPKVVVEIGTCHGGTLYLWCQAADPAATLISVDLAAGEFGGGYRPCRAQLYQQFKLPGQTVHLVQADSHAAETFEKIRQLVGPRKVDFLFIDGDHTYEGVQRDFELYRPLLAEDGVIALHDILKRPDQPRIEVWKFWEELKRTHHETREWVEPEPNKRAIGIGLVQASR